MLTLQINGKPRTLSLVPPATLEAVLQELQIKLDRVAVEHNNDIAPRTTWPARMVHDGDRLEVVHFVGGGLLQIETS